MQTQQQLKRVSSFVTGLIILMVSTTAQADASSSHADRCYRQTVLVHSGADPASLDVMSCDRAFNRAPIGNRELRSSLLHNSGVVLLAMGESNAARERFERAIKIFPEVGLSHLALAQLAQRQGNLVSAIALYDQILESEPSHEIVSDNLEIIAKNRSAAVSAQRLESIALNTSTQR